MATCSFIKATEARNLARNNTLLWTEICEVQAAILAAIDSNEYSVLVNDGTPMTSTQSILSAAVTAGGTGYNLVSATAVINANDTAGTGATVTPVVTGTTITSFTVTAPGTGYTPISATATVGVPSELIDAQDETDFNNGAGNGTFAAGSQYRATETITLSDGHTVTVDTIGASTGVALTAGQDETDFDNVGANGDFAGGVNHAAGTTITLSDGSVLDVDTVVGGVVTEFTVTTASTAQFASGATLVQVSTTGVGTGFTLTSDTNNEISLGPVATFTLNTVASIPFFYPTTINQTSSSAIGTNFSLTPKSTNITALVGGIGAVLTPIVTNGAITDVIINSPGSGYSLGAPILFPTPASGTGATAIVNAVGVGGTITSIAVTNPGSGYATSTATVTVTAPGSLTPAVQFAGTVSTTTASSSNNYTSLAFATGANTITRTGGTVFTTDFTLGDKIIVANAEDPENDGTYTIASVTATVITTTEAITTTNATDTTATINNTAKVSGIIITEGGSGYAPLYPTVSITDATGQGAVITTNIAGGAVTALNVDDGGYGYTAPTLTIVAAPTSAGAGATGTATVGTNTFGTDPSDYNDVLIGQSTDAVITDQIQYVLDYFTALGYNIRAQTNSATGYTMQWQIVW